MILNILRLEVHNPFRSLKKLKWQFTLVKFSLIRTQRKALTGVTINQGIIILLLYIIIETLVCCPNNKRAIIPLKFIMKLHESPNDRRQTSSGMDYELPTSRYSESYFNILFILSAYPIIKEQ